VGDQLGKKKKPRGATTDGVSFKQQTDKNNPRQGTGRLDRLPCLKYIFKYRKSFATQHSVGADPFCYRKGDAGTFFPQASAAALGGSDRTALRQEVPREFVSAQLKKKKAAGCDSKSRRRGALPKQQTDKTTKPNPSGTTRHATGRLDRLPCLIKLFK
jgi:hypothetical protein